MAIDEVREERKTFGSPEGQGHSGAMVAVFVVLALLVIGQIYTLTKMSGLRESIQTQDVQTHKEIARQLTDDFSNKLSALENSNAQQMDGLKTELDQASGRVGTTGKELRRARAMVTKLQKEEAAQADQLKAEIAKKADQEQLGALSQDVNSTKSDLDGTKKTVSTLTGDLGMARSELGTLIATNHQDIEALRKLGERDYFEFTLKKGDKETVAGVGLLLKKTNLKRHRFNLDLLADDMEIQKNNRTVNEPIFFAVSGSRKFYELVVNTIGTNEVKGYMSTPKGASPTGTPAAANPTSGQ